MNSNDEIPETFRTKNRDPKPKFTIGLGMTLMRKEAL
jgi:hypothetical protein